MITLEHADLEFPGYFASVSAEVTGTGMVHLCVGSEPDDDDENSAVIRITADGAEELARALAERAAVARRRQALASLESVILTADEPGERLR